MRVEKDRVREIVHSAVDHANAALPPGHHIVSSSSTLLTGDGGALSSLDVIAFILAVEEKVNAAFSTQLLLFDDTLIADPDGPFRTLGTLVDHVHSAVERS